MVHRIDIRPKMLAWAIRRAGHNVDMYLSDHPDVDAWYRQEKREWVQIYPGDPGCIVSKAAFEKGIGYMYRDEPTKDRPDSGWRFFHGDESDEYANNPDNLQIIGINAICNLRPDILAYLEAPNGSAYGWNGQDWIKEKLYGEGDNR